jgi:hypothetical protein
LPFVVELQLVRSISRYVDANVSVILVRATSLSVRFLIAAQGKRAQSHFVVRYRSIS